MVSHLKISVQAAGSVGVSETSEPSACNWATARAASVSARRSHLLPLRALPLLRLPALSWLPGHIPAHEARCAALGKRLMSRPISAASTSVVRRPTPGMVSSRSRAASCSRNRSAIAARGAPQPAPAAAPPAPALPPPGEDAGPALPPPVLPHRGPIPRLPTGLRRFAVRGWLSYIRLGLEVLRAPDLRG